MQALISKACSILNTVDSKHATLMVKLVIPVFVTITHFVRFNIILYDICMEVTFCHPLERLANSPVGFCSEKPATAGLREGVTGIHCHTIFITLL